MKFIIELQRFGSLQFKIECNAKPSMAIGARIPNTDQPYLPDYEDVISKLPLRYKKAFKRANGLFWSGESIGCDVVRCDLLRYDNEPMGTLFAKLSTRSTTL